MSNVVYGDPLTQDIFEQEKPFITKSGMKVISKEPYAKQLAKVYEEYFSGIPDTQNNFSVKAGEAVEGKIVSITKDEISIDIGQREFGYISIDKDKINPSDYSIGDEIEAIVLVDQERAEYLKISISEKVKKEIYEDMRDSKSKKVYKAKVIGLSNNGYELDISGLKVFMPGSLGGINKLVDFNELVGKTINVMTVKNNNSYSKYKNTLIVSHREYLKTLRDKEVEKLKVGNRYTGYVTGTEAFGVFVEFSAEESGAKVLTGLIHKDEFDEGLTELFEQGVVKPGVEIEFYLKEVVTETRIILSRKPVEERKPKGPKFKKDQVVKGTVTTITTYGAFVQFHKRTSGLVHISKMGDKTVKEGESVECKIININNGKYDLAFV